MQRTALSGRKAVFHRGTQEATSTQIKPMKILYRLLLLQLTGGFLLLSPLQAAPQDEQDDGRVKSGLQVIYDFSLSAGPVVKDRSGAGRPVDLVIAGSSAVRRSSGSLEVRSKTLIQSGKEASRLVESIRSSGSVSIEAWIRPAKTTLDGPARILTLSKDSTNRNFTLGQEKDRYVLRLRTTKTSSNGLPSLDSSNQSLTPAVTHVVYTRARGGLARIYINGKKNVEKKIGGSPSNWDGAYRLALADELSGGRPWLGTYYLVAVYNRDLSPAEVERNFKAGPGVKASPALAARQKLTAGEKLFDQHIAPLLSRHCLECHDAATKKGKLDLSAKGPAFSGGKNGKVIIPGKPLASPLWKLVENDKMPKKRPALSKEEKKRLRDWIDSGSVWVGEEIDPLAHTRDKRAGGTWLQRLTLDEYIETVRDSLGVDVAEEARKVLPRDQRADGFSNTAYNLTVDLKHVESYAKLARVIVKKMDVVKFSARFAKKQKLIDDDMRDLISKMGRWLLRGPLQEREVVSYRGISTTVASAGGNYRECVELIIEAMLQSPRFIYRVENQRGDGQLWPAGEYELASRLSYILWGSSPDQELMKAAGDGKLADRKFLSAQVRRMLNDPRARKQSSRFIGEWLNLGRLDNMAPSRKLFPGWEQDLAQDMRRETLAFFDDVVWKQRRPFWDLLNAQVTFATPRLAKHYGIEARGKGLVRYELASVPGRGGLLTQGSLLTIGGDEASMVTRGLFILTELLRSNVKDPPPGTDTTPVPARPGLTKRAISETRVADASCGGCHSKFEPLAFGLEKYDGLGSRHDRDEHGNPLREDGEISLPGSGKTIHYRTTAELMDLLAGSERVRETLAWKLAQFALGRPLLGSDRRILGEIYAAARKNGGSYQDLMTAIVLSNLVTSTRTENE
jgi:mono/diheme cytochrome c family protein